MVILSNPAAPLEAGDIVDAVWDEAASGHVAGGSIGALVERLDLLAAGGAGELTAARAALLSNVDVAVSTTAAVKTSGGGHFTFPTSPSAGLDVAVGGSNSYGSFVQVTASTSAALLITALHHDNDGGTSNTYTVYDIAVGGAGSEVSADEIHLGGASSAHYMHPQASIYPPVAIASGVRLAIRGAHSHSSGETHRISIAAILASDIAAL